MKTDHLLFFSLYIFAQHRPSVAKKDNIRAAMTTECRLLDSYQCKLSWPSMLKIEANGAWGGRRSITASLKRTQCFELLCKCRIIQLMLWCYEILIMLKWTIQFWQMIFATLCICILVIDLFLPKNCKKENKNLNHQQWASLVAFAGGTYCRHLSLNGCHRSAAITLTVMQKENILCLYDDGKF